MNGNINWEDAKLFLKADTKVYRLEDLQGEKAAAIMKELHSIGENRGVYVNFKPMEEVHFPKAEHAQYIVDGFVIYNGERRLSLSCMAYCEKYGYFAFPMSLLRRIPLQEKLQGQDRSEYDQLCTNNALGEQLMAAQDDFCRVQMLEGHTLVITDRLLGHRYGFVIDEVTKKPRQDTNKLTPLICYKVRLG